MSTTVMADVLAQMPGYIGWKDIHMHYLGCNINLAHTLQFNHTSDIINLTDADLPGPESVSIYHKKNDELVLKGATIKAIHQSSTPYDGSLFYYIKKPLLNESSKIAGIIYHCQELISTDFITNLSQVDKKYRVAQQPLNYKIESSINYCNLSPRELECLFCLLRGMSAKKIAECLALSKRTVETYIDNIKNKLGCQSKAQLLVLAVSEGFMQIIPERFINEGKSIF